MLRPVLALAASMVIGLSSSAFADRLFAVSGSGNTTSSLYELDPTTGAVISTIGSTGFSHVTGLAFHPTTGVLYGVVSDFFGSGTTLLVTIDVNTGAATSIGTTSNQIPDVSFSSAGVLYAWSEFNQNSGDSDVLVTINLATGAVTQIGTNNVGTFQTGLAFAPGGTLYVKPSSSLYTVDPTTGAVTFVNSYGVGFHNMLAFDSAGVAFTGQRTGGGLDLWTIDPVGGGQTFIGTAGIGNISALAFMGSTIVPEPSTYALFGLGTLGLGFVVRRRRAARAKASEAQSAS